MNNLDKKYTDLLQDILDNGTRKMDRTGTGTISVFGRQIRHKMSDGFPLLTTKKMPFKTIVTELLWFLRGDTNIKFLVDNNCHIWDGDAYKNYKSKINLQNNWEITLRVGGVDTIGQQELLSQEEFIRLIKTDDEFANKWGELGPIYGEQWRNWKGYSNEDWDAPPIDQIANLINDLKTNPDSRRLLVSAWNPADLPHQVLPPCHYGFQVYTRELSHKERTSLLKKLEILQERRLDNATQEMVSKLADSYNIPTRAISLMWAQRSCDFPLGIPTNIMSYTLLLTILGKMVNMVPEELIGNLGDCHIYLNQIDGVNEQLGRELSFEERRDLMVKYTQDNNLLPIPYILPFGEESKNKYLEICDKYKIPKRTREPYPLPTLKHMKTDEFYKSLGEDLSLLSHLTIDDFVLENYKSHPKIYFPLSN
jgi:thymidylate synthase